MSENASTVVRTLRAKHSMDVSVGAPGNVVKKPAGSSTNYGLRIGKDSHNCVMEFGLPLNMNAKQNPRLIWHIFFVFVALASFDLALAGDDTNATKRAPDFALKDTEGRLVKLEDFTGKALIVSFVVTWDEPSLEQIKILSELVIRHGDKEVAVLAMSIEQPERPSTKAYVEQEHPNFSFLVANLETIRAFGGVSAVPTTFVIDKDRTIIKRHVGVTGKSVFENDLKLASPQ